MIKKNLSFEERWAISQLIELVRDANILVPDDSEFSSDGMLRTTGEVLDLYSIDKKDWELCLKAIEYGLSGLTSALSTIMLNL